MPPRVPLEERKRIIELFLEGRPQRHICSLLNRSRRAANRAIQAYRREHGRLVDAGRSGRPRITQGETDRQIVAAVVVDPFITAKEIREQLNLSISCCTIRRRLNEAGLRNCVAAQKPRLTDRQKCLRLKFARAVKDWGAEEWEKVVFSDECTFYTRGDQQQRVWRPLNSR